MRKNMKRTMALVVILALVCVTGALAQGFVPSVSGAPVPQPLFAVTSTGEKIDLGEGSNSWLIVIPADERQNMAEGALKDTFDKAYDAVAETDSLGDLKSVDTVDDNNPILLHDEFATRLADDQSKKAVEDFVGSDMYLVTADAEHANYLDDAETYIDITFDTNYEADQEIYGLYTNDGEKFDLLENKNVTINADGTTTVRVYDFGIHAAAVPEAED
jgi:hypothetical protein